MNFKLLVSSKSLIIIENRLSLKARYNSQYIFFFFILFLLKKKLVFSRISILDKRLRENISNAVERDVFQARPTWMVTVKFCRDCFGVHGLLSERLKGIC